MESLKLYWMGSKKEKHIKIFYLMTLMDLNVKLDILK